MSSLRTFDDLLAIARRFEDEPLETLTGRTFTARVFRDKELVFTPIATGNSQSDGRKAQLRFFDRYLETRSLRPSDYQDVSRNASYLIGLLIAAGERE